MTFGEERAEGERLGGSPIDTVTGFNCFAAGVEKPLDRAVNMKALRRRRYFRADVFNHLEINAGIAAPRIVGGLRDLESGPTSVQPVGFIGLVALARLQLGIEPGAPVALHLFDLAVGDDALGNQ